MGKKTSFENIQFVDFVHSPILQTEQRNFDCRRDFCPQDEDFTHWSQMSTYRGADKSLTRPGRKQATATEDFDVHISYL